MFSVVFLEFENWKVSRADVHKPNLEGLFFSGLVVHGYDEVLPS
jgi:hypothetical protein